MPVAIHVPADATDDAGGDESTEVLASPLAEGDWDAAAHPPTASKKAATLMAVIS
jgi:hypothetical protein